MVLPILGINNKHERHLSCRTMASTLFDDVTSSCARLDASHAGGLFMLDDAVEDLTIAISE